LYVEQVGIVGGGTMGGDIAAVFLLAGIPTVVRDVDETQIDRVRAHIETRFAERVKRGRLSAPEAQRRLAGLTLTTNWEAFSRVDLAIEAVPERLAIKQAVFRELDRVLPPLAVMASNTSALSITEMGRATTRPHRVAGFHFFFPAVVMRLIEVVAGQDTDQDTVLSLVRVAEEIHKLPVRVRECPGFVVNRVLMRSLAEVFRFQEETGVGAAAIDRAVMDSRTAPMGPFQLADALGLDITLDVAQTLERAYGDRFRPGEALVGLVQEGRLGQKSGGGFYGGDRPESDPVEVERARELVRRQQLAAFAEAGRLVDEGISSPRDIDVALRAGAGLPMGPLAWADAEGLDRIAAELEELEVRHGTRFEAPASLRRLIGQGALGVRAGRGYHVYRGRTA
jgi:3-hydroxyacyl-CoA dehydrogenase